jgi:hypothetical protein
MELRQQSEDHHRSQNAAQYSLKPIFHDNSPFVLYIWVYYTTIRPPVKRECAFAENTHKSYRVAAIRAQRAPWRPSLLLEEKVPSEREADVVVSRSDKLKYYGCSAAYTTSVTCGDSFCDSPRAAFGGCSLARACGRSPQGEATGGCAAPTGRLPHTQQQDMKVYGAKILNFA